MEAQVTVDEKSGKITIVMPIEPAATPTEKGNVTIATTRGNRQVAATYKGKPVTVGVNVYYKPDPSPSTKK